MAIVMIVADAALGGVNRLMVMMAVMSSLK